MGVDNSRDLLSLNQHKQWHFILQFFLWVLTLSLSKPSTACITVGKAKLLKTHYWVSQETLQKI